MIGLGASIDWWPLIPHLNSKLFLSLLFVQILDKCNSVIVQRHKPGICDVFTSAIEGLSCTNNPNLYLFLMDGSIIMDDFTRAPSRFF